MSFLLSGLGALGSGLGAGARLLGQAVAGRGVDAISGLATGGPAKGISGLLGKGGEAGGPSPPGIRAPGPSSLQGSLGGPGTAPAPSAPTVAPARTTPTAGPNPLLAPRNLPQRAPLDFGTIPEAIGAPPSEPTFLDRASATASRVAPGSAAGPGLALAGQLGDLAGAVGGRGPVQPNIWEDIGASLVALRAGVRPQPQLPPPRAAPPQRKAPLRRPRSNRNPLGAGAGDDRMRQIRERLGSRGRFVNLR